MTDRDRPRLVEQAKGVVMLRYGVSSYEALAALARWAREAHVSLAELAHALVKGVCQGRATPDSRGLVRWLEHRLRADLDEAATAPRHPCRPWPGGPVARPQPRRWGWATPGVRGWRRPGGPAVALRLGGARGPGPGQPLGTHGRPGATAFRP